MLVWGKIIGATIGFMFGGVFGAVLGAVLGNFFDKEFPSFYTFYLGPAKLEQIKAEFFKATFSVMGHLARADGVVTPQEIKMATKLMDEMHLSKEQRMLAIDLFRAGKRPDFNLDMALKNLMQACSWRYDLLQIFMEIQFQAAYADGDVKAQEKDMLMYLCQQLRFTRIDYNRFDALYGYKANYHYQNSRSSSGSNSRYSESRENPLDKAYKIMGVDPNITESNLKKAYRKLISQHHPDKLISKGLPQEMLKLATEKTQEIQAAYDRIKLAKGWR